MSEGDLRTDLPLGAMAVLFMLAAYRAYLVTRTKRVSEAYDFQRSSIPRILLVACLLRAAWSVLELLKFFSEGSDNGNGEGGGGGGDGNSFTQGCKDRHLYVTALGRFANLLFFTAFSTQLTFWWTAVAADDERSTTSAFVAASDAVVSSVVERGAGAQVGYDATNPLNATSTITMHDAYARLEGSHGSRQTITGTTRTSGIGSGYYSSTLTTTTTAARGSRYDVGGITGRGESDSDETSMLERQRQLLRQRGWFSPLTLHLLVNFWCYVVMFILFLIKLFQCDDVTYEGVNKAENITIAFFYMIISPLFLSVGWRLGAKLAALQAWERRTQVRGVAFVCSLVFLVKSVLFLVQPIANYTFRGTARDVLYPWFFYVIPELLPTILVLRYLWWSGPRRAGSATEVSPLLTSSSSSSETGASSEGLYQQQGSNGVIMNTSHEGKVVRVWEL